ncbi:MAG TPA: chitinase [Ktedonobacteraceae bacterium]|nr:chitinase [Ktedonobacteraceae bacterium]
MSWRKLRLVGWMIFSFWSICALSAGGGLEAALAQRGSGVGHQGAQMRRQADWPARYFAPYNNDAARETDLLALARSSGARFFTLAFIENAQGQHCRASWNTRQPIGSWMRASIEALRASGGDVRVAFGGAVHAELATSCKTLPELVAQYQAVIDTYDLTHLDFDIEGKTLRDTHASDLRNRAIAFLQQRAAQAGRPLSISYTLPVGTTGLNASGLQLLRNALHNGVRVDVVNLMTMDYYSKNAPVDQMGRNAIAAAQSAFRQLRQLYPTKSAAQLWGMLGLTPMIGVNDHTNEIFTLQDAYMVLSFARQQHLPLLAFWSMGRDRSCASDQTAPHGCSGVEQEPYDYAQIFAPFGQ